MKEVRRFAPSATGRAHPGTLLSALLAWLDCRHCGGEFVLRLEDLDPERCSAQWREGLLEDLKWFGLDWDRLEVQSQQTERYHWALEQLADLGRLYACSCSRQQIKSYGKVAADGGWVYNGNCRDLRVTRETLEVSTAAIRCRMNPGTTQVTDQLGATLSMDVSGQMGDPILKRKDGSYAYQLASVVDDATEGVTRIVRGRDIIPSTAIQVQLQQFLGWQTPKYYHHFLLLELHQEKFSKFHQAVSCEQLREFYSPAELCGFLAWVAQLQPENLPISPCDLIAGFDWQRVEREDQVLFFSAQGLTRL